jgi:hypothetical protein
MKKTRVTTSTKTVSKEVELKQLTNDEFGTVKVVTTADGDGFASIDDLCEILNLSKTEIKETLTGHFHTVSPKRIEVTEYDMDFTDEFGLYMLFLLSKEVDAIRVQEWLEEEFLDPLHEQKKNQMGLDEDALIISDSTLGIEALRYLATAENVRRSGHFRVVKDVPELTMSHLMGWWYNPNDTSTFMLQFNSKSNGLVYKNVRMNIYLKKMKDGSTDQCRMTISFLDLDDDNSEFFAIDTHLPSYVLSENAILNHIFEAYFLPIDLVDSANKERVMILNGVISFHRSRRV